MGFCLAWAPKQANRRGVTRRTKVDAQALVLNFLRGNIGRRELPHVQVLAGQCHVPTSGGCAGANTEDATS